MSYFDLVEDYEAHDIVWKRIKGDHAFALVLDGWFDYFKSEYMKYVKNTDVVIQAGGFCGIHPRLFSDIFNIVYTFEPDPLNFFCLTLNCQKDNIVKTQGALGKTHEMISVVRTCDTNKGMNVVLATDDAAIPTHVIDDFNLRSCDLIQLDVEGYEYNILQGAENTIKKFKPVITVEDTNQNIEKYLSQYGYEKKVTIHRDSVFAI